eukprot:CAMPEP_0198112176 /NCGR_PEP_ID=MMETSP1442-20131203/4051_1 /TAXON_ID= /ORGANISM="Craspedostauros australis, Strain CCMP3328" /LENGTH=328 /DNA_ID=CAMNT_0043768867 /DNA_START=81 /DNA_END=1067 /DNA_ORIENTATION=-
MKFTSQILAFCVVQSAILGGNAYVVQNNNKQPSSNGQLNSQASSYTERSTFSTGTVSAKDDFIDKKNTYNPALAADTNNAGDMQLVKSVWETVKPVTVQGGSLRTCVPPASAGLVQVLLKTDGRPLNANVELWQGPDNTPQKMAVYIEDGELRPFNCAIATPRSNNAIAIRNTGHLEFPMAACVEPDVGNAVGSVTKKLAALSIPKTIQGGAIQTYPFSPAVSSVQVMLKTDGRPLNARIELLQGPNNNKQVMEVYTEDGLERPFFAVIETPGVGNVVRVVNTGTVEFPLSVNVEPFLIDPDANEHESVWDNDTSWDNGGGSFFFGSH